MAESYTDRLERIGDELKQLVEGYAPNPLDAEYVNPYDLLYVELPWMLQRLRERDQELKETKINADCLALDLEHVHELKMLAYDQLRVYRSKEKS